MTAIELVTHILDLFKNYRNNLKIINHLEREKIIHSSFENRYLLNNIDFEFKLIETIYKNIDLVDFYFEATDGSPYRLELIFEDKWYLKSFLFQCQSCFGEDKNCQVCGGSGWGVL